MASPPSASPHGLTRPVPPGTSVPAWCDGAFQAMIDASIDAVLITDEQRRLVWWNDAALDLFLIDAAEAAGRSVDDLFDHGIDPRHDAPPLPDGLTLHGLRSDGYVFPCARSVATWDGPDGPRHAIFVRDMTEQRDLESRLEHLAFHDPLTMLANRALFANDVDRAIKRLARHPAHVGVLFLDLDDFKRINDSFGHAAGDSVLLSTAERLRRCVRTTDTVARLGGDEFAVLVEDASHPLAPLEIADRIVNAMIPSFTIGNLEIDVSCSIGVAVVTDRHTVVSELLRDADLAMYAAKARGKNCIELFENCMYTAILERVNLEGDLRLALERGEISAHFQPIMDLASGRIKGFEALARWHHPTRGLISPESFIEIAEATGLIVPLGKTILQQACLRAGEWQREFRNAPPLRISVNLSSRQIEDPMIVTTVVDALERAELDPRQLTLEITESLVVKRNGLAGSRLNELASLGIGLAIDDFGVGYSSLSYLQDLPLTMLKIDRSFVERVHEPRGATLIQAIIAMGRSLGLSIVAEGIETTDQLRVLTDLGCTAGQGFLFAKSLAPIEAAAFLAAERPIWWWGLVG